MMGNFHISLLKDKYLIQGILDHSTIASHGSIVVFAHGFACTPEDPLYAETAPLFTANGHDTLRFAFYGPQENQRQIKDTTLAQNAEDLNIVLDHLSDTYKEIYLIGHSFGGLASLMACPDNIKALSLWDTTLFPDTRFAENDLRFDAETEDYHYVHGNDAVVGASLIAETQEITADTIDALATKLNKPVQILFAENGSQRWHEDSFFTSFTGPKEKEVIANADHFFTQMDAKEKLFEKTFKWFSRYAAS